MLGVVIGVSTVMAMATIVSGVRDQIVATIEIAGPTTFYVMKVLSQTPINPQDVPAWIRMRPDLTTDDAERIAKLPEIKYAAIWAQIQTRTEYAGERTNVGVDHGRRRRLSRDLRRRAGRRPLVHASRASERRAGRRALSRRRAESCSATFSRSTSGCASADARCA